MTGVLLGRGEDTDTLGKWPVEGGGRDGGRQLQARPCWESPAAGGSEEECFP